jgi:hypothetical protein
MSMPTLPKLTATSSRAPSVTTQPDQPDLPDTRTRSSTRSLDGDRPSITRPSRTHAGKRPRQDGNLIALGTLGASVDQPQPPDVHLARNLPDFERKLAAQRAVTPGPAQLTAAAKLVNEVRHNPLAQGAGGIVSHDALAQLLSPAVLRDFQKNVLQLSDAKIQAMDDMATQGGRCIPSSGSLFQAVLYGAIPFAALESTPTKVLGGSVAALAAQPFVTAGLQTPIVSAITVMRQKGGPMGKMPGNLKASTTLQQIEADLVQLKDLAQKDDAAMGDLLKDLAAKHPEHALPAGPAPTEEQLRNFLRALTPDERQGLERIQNDQTARAVQAAGLVLDGLRLEGMQKRQKNSTNAQVFWRTLRGLSGILAPAMQSKHVPAAAITGVSVAIALGALLGQHVGAGQDERTAQADELRLSILYGDLFNAEGQADWNAGQPIRSTGIDPKKLQGLVVEPEMLIAGRVSAMVDSHRQELEARLAAHQAQAPAPGTDPEAGDRVAAQLAAEIADCERDIQKIADGHLTGLEENGFARQLFGKAMQNTAVAFAWSEGWAKLRSPLEYSAQVGQRLSQQFTFGVLGGAGALLLGRGVNAVVYEVNKHLAAQSDDPAPAHKPIGGTSSLPAWAQVMLAAGAGGIALYSAMTQYSAVNVKNARRDIQGGKDNDPGLGDQMKKGWISPLWQGRANSAGTAAQVAGHELLQVGWRSTTAMRSALAADAVVAFGD